MQQNLFDTQNLKKLHIPCVQLQPIVIRNYNDRKNEMKIKDTVVIVQSCWIDDYIIFSNVGIAYGSGYNRIVVTKHFQIEKNKVKFDDTEKTRGINGKKIDEYFYHFVNENIVEIKKLLIELSV